jgi:hypothetical protein
MTFASVRSTGAARKRIFILAFSSASKQDHPTRRKPVLIETLVLSGKDLGERFTEIWGVPKVEDRGVPFLFRSLGQGGLLGDEARITFESEDATFKRSSRSDKPERMVNRDRAKSPHTPNPLAS